MNKAAYVALLAMFVIFGGAVMLTAGEHPVRVGLILGGMLLLDVLDRSSAVEMDTTTGVNNSYFFLEWYRSQLGTSDQMKVGTSTWMLGLALEI